ncbi:NifB/NifX family molybdenum-iron cluster-binding protein [Methanothermobacter thermautotrophicus]|nr:NifB/NifX family molybdenum-iron cluster-binding protein [Methanothermobacter thermautotrophicus]
MKIAVASDDGKYVNRHFADADSLIIFERIDNEIKFSEIRRIDERRLEKHDDRWGRVMDLIDDCEVVICSKIGEKPLDEAKRMGIIVFESDRKISAAILKSLTDLNIPCRI